MKPSGTHFPGLDVIRAFACLSVFVGHMFDYINNRTLSNNTEAWFYDHFVLGAGAMGVSLFFVLSGFLITYLLIREKDARNKIHVGFFYMKRILRIWPLFFLVTIAGFFIVPLVTGTYDGTLVKQHLPWFLTFTNNIDRINTDFIGSGNDSLGVLWSVAVEEQFYLLWPLLILVTPKKLFPAIAVGIVIFSAGFRYVHATDADKLFYHSFSVVGDLATGGLIAWLGFYSDSFRRFFGQLSTGIRVTVLVLVATAIFNHHYFLQGGIFVVTGRFLLCMCFAWLIADQCYGRKETLNFERIPFLTKIGVVSYGFYCFHMFVIMAIQKMNVMLHLDTINMGIFYGEFILAFFLTLGISIMSYRYFEKQFMKYRSRFDIMSKPVPW